LIETVPFGSCVVGRFSLHKAHFNGQLTKGGGENIG
jgi:hypothetical protein